jgi:hypothetical protein
MAISIEIATSRLGLRNLFDRLDEDIRSFFDEIRLSSNQIFLCHSCSLMYFFA